MVYTTSRAVEAGVEENRVRRMVSETKKFVTESCQQAARNCMQVMGGIGYTNVYPIERHVRDLGLASIWTGSNEVMSLIVAHEWYKEKAAQEKISTARQRDFELDAAESSAAEEKVFE